MRVPDDERWPSAGRLEQLLRLQERLLVETDDVPALAARLCQGAAVLIGVAGSRLVVEADGGRLHTLATYGRVNGGPGAGAQSDDDDADRHGVTTIPVPAEGAVASLQLAPEDGRSLSLAQIELGRYVASLAAVALRLAARRARAARAERATYDLMMTLGHDLRQPINALLGYTQLLLDDTYGPCSHEQRPALQAMERNAHELLALVRGALDVARAHDGNGAAVLEEFSVADLFEELCTGSLAARAPAGVRLTWRAETVPAVRSDRFRVRQILQNLVDNALRFTAHGTIELAAATGDGRLRLSVSDTGSGISTSDLPHLFEAFRTGRAGGGSGCGLYLVKQFAESLAGRVTVESTVGAGTRFTVDLPLQA